MTKRFSSAAILNDETLKHLVSDALAVVRDAHENQKRWRFELADHCRVTVRTVENWLYAETPPGVVHLLLLLDWLDANAPGAAREIRLWLNFGGRR